jgi:ABC-type branched-subunit amino acid transport system ATPase component
MSNLRDAAQKALKALEGWKDDAPSWWTTGDEKTITALKAALEQPVTDWLVCPACNHKSPYSQIKAKTLAEEEERLMKHARAALKQPERTLTDEVIADLWHANGGFHHHFARAVERYLKGEK